MAERCPCCGQELPRGLSDDPQALLAAMKQPGRKGHRRNEVYRPEGRSYWVVIYGANEGEPSRYSESAVNQLVRAGHLRKPSWCREDGYLQLSND